MGLGITLKVMAGDKIDIRGKSYYNQANTDGSTANGNLEILDILNGLVGTAGGVVATTAHETVTGSQLNGSTSTTQGINDFIKTPQQNDVAGTTKLKAFINYIFFNEQFQYVASGYSRVSDMPGFKNHEMMDIPISKNGYIFIYCSNESPVNVFFDNVQAAHTRGPILEETHYYPFGLVQQGISSKAAGTTENKKKYQQYELNTDFDINLYESFYRSHDPQLGRFWQIDPRPTDFESPYAAMGNNPIRNMDPLGDTIIIRYMSEGKQVESIYQDGSFYKRDGSRLSKDDNGYGSKAYSDLYTLDKLGDKEVSRRIDVLEDSKNLHFIEMPASGDNNGNSPTSTEDDKNGKPTGSTTKYDPDAKTNARGDKRDPIVGLAHELLGHGYDSDQGKSNHNKTKNGIPMYEVSGVNIENRVRAKTGDPKKTTYGGQPIPATLLDDTHKKKKP